MLRIWASLLYGALVLILMPSSAFSARSHFIGELATKWLDDGRKMVVLEPYGFVDSKGSLWEVPPGAEVNGAQFQNNYGA